MLDAVRGGLRFQRALEVGCSEGLFSGSLAARCESVLAVDISPIALARARERCRWSNHVRFAEWNLRRDPVPGTYDLIVVESVFEYFHRPSAIRAARAKLVDALSPGGYLLVGNSRESEVVESAWWGKPLIRGAQWIDVFMAEHPRLRVVATVADDFYVDTLFRKIH